MDITFFFVNAMKHDAILQIFPQETLGKARKSGAEGACLYLG